MSSVSQCFGMFIGIMVRPSWNSTCMWSLSIVVQFVNLCGYCVSSSSSLDVMDGLAWCLYVYALGWMMYLAFVKCFPNALGRLQFHV